MLTLTIFLGTVLSKTKTLKKKEEKKEDKSDDDDDDDNDEVLVMDEEMRELLKNPHQFLKQQLSKK